MHCKICGTPTSRAFDAEVLVKYRVDYYHCTHCGFLQTEEPYWLSEAYNSAIAAADTGLVQRNLFLSKKLSVLLFFTFGRDGKYLDVAGGYGMLTRLMRDIGFDFYWSDKYCQNLLALGFEAIAGSAFKAVTAFEVLEHVPDPLGFISESMMLAKSRTMIFSTVLYEGAPPEPESWWYYSFETGQHVSFFQRMTLRVIAEKLGLNFHSRGSVHMLTDKKISSGRFRLFTSARFCRIAFPLIQRLLVSKTMSDHLDMMSRNR